MTHSHHSRARLIRRVSNSTALEEALTRVGKVLCDAGIPAIVVGGYAVQEHGYPRYTTDLDLVVPDIEIAHRILSTHGFAQGIRGLRLGASSFEIDLKLGGSSTSGYSISFPSPMQIGTAPKMASLEALIAGKLSVFARGGVQELRHLTDVIELMKANDLPREFDPGELVSEMYRELWEALQRPTDVSFRSEFMRLVRSW